MSAVAITQERSIDLFPRQRRFVLDPARFPGYVGGIGSGKSFAGAAKVIARIDRAEIGGVYAPTYPMLRDATKRTLLALLDLLAIPYIHHITDNTITIPSTGHEIICRSLDNPDSMRGPNLAYAWVDELSLATREAWNVVIGRVRVGDKPQAWATFTPKGRNFCWEIWERDANPDHPLYRVKTTENPELPPDFAESLGYAGRFADQELGGEFVAHDGLVYPTFGRLKNVRSIDCGGWATLLALDVGTRNPTALLTIRHAGDRIHVERELYRRGLSTDDIATAVAAEATRIPSASLVIDPSAAGIAGSLRQRGVRVRSANNDVVAGIARVTAALPDLTVDPACVNLIAEFESYAYPPEGKSVAVDAPIKANDHALDALRYAVNELTGRGGVYVR